MQIEKGQLVSNPAELPLPGARKALVLLLLINLFNYVDRSILFSVTDVVREDFKVSSARMGLLTTAFLVTYMLISPIFGWLGDRTSRWRIIGVGVILWSLASGGSGLATTYAIMLSMRCMIGIGEAAYGPVAPTLISDLYPISVRGNVLAWFYTAMPVGTAIGYVLGGLFAHPNKWHHAFLLTIPPGVILGVWCFLMPEPARGSADAGGGAHRKATIADYKLLAKIKSYVICTAGMAAMCFAIGGMQAWVPTWLVKDRGLDPAKSGLIFGAILVVAGLVATIAGGITGDKLRARFPGSYFLVSAAGLLAAFPLFLGVIFVPFPYAWVLMFFALFCLFFNTGPGNTILANVTPPAIRATGFAVNILIIHAFGDVASPPIIGLIRDKYNLTVGFVVVSLTMLLGGVIWLFGARHLQSDTEAAPRLMEPSSAPPPSH